MSWRRNSLDASCLFVVNPCSWLIRAPDHGKSKRFQVSSPVDIIQYDSLRKEEIAHLLNLSLAAKVVGQRDSAYWAWKHEDNPMGRSLMLLAESDGQIVGVRALMRWKLALDGETVLAVKPVDSVTHPDFQRQGIFKRLTTAACEIAAEEGVQLIFNTPNANSMPGYLKMGWRQTSAMPLYIKPLRPLHSVARATQWKLNKNRIAPPIDAYFRTTPRNGKNTLEEYGEEVKEVLAGQPRRSGALTTDQTLDFLHWRYASHPNISYFGEVDILDGRLHGVAFYRTNLRKGLREVMIDDLVIRDSGIESARRLVGSIIRNSRADYLLAIGGPAAKSRYLRRLGFYRVPKMRFDLAVRHLASEFSEAAYQEDCWSLCLGDLEGL